MDEEKIKAFLTEASEQVREVLGEDFEDVGFIIIMRTRVAGPGWFAIASDVEKVDLVNSTLRAAVRLTDFEPERVVRPFGRAH